MLPGTGGQRRYLDRDDNGPSPVHVVRRRVPMRVSVMTHNPGKDLIPFIDS